MTLGDKIYTLRTKAGYSQEEFAAVIGVSRQSISKWETSVVMPDTEYVIKICKTLHVSADTLIMDDDLSNAENPQQASLDVTSVQEEKETIPVPTALTEEVELQNTATPFSEGNSVLSLVGFILSFILLFSSLVLCCICFRRTKEESTAINYFAISGIAISCCKIFALLATLAVLLVEFVL